MEFVSDNASFPNHLSQQVQRYPTRTALTFIADDGAECSWTYEQLWANAWRFSEALPEVDEPVPRALLLFPPGIEFVAAYLGCQLAGWIPVPTCYPRRGRPLPRVDSAARDCLPSAIVGNETAFDGIDDSDLCEQATGIPRVVVDLNTTVSVHAVDTKSFCVGSDDIAMLQYTSGSTSDPKGVVVRQRNLMANLEAIRRGFGIESQREQGEPPTGVFWLPFFHDMGLIGGILAPLYVGGHSVLMSPQTFLRSPIRWLRAISDYGATISGAPNFAYQLCVDRISPSQTEDLDLSRWQIAFCGAEPILPRTLQEFGNRFAANGFRSSAFYPCYGLAESTLLVAGGDGPAEPEVLSVDRDSLAQGHAKVRNSVRHRDVTKLVSCGSAVDGVDVVIVSPATREACPEGVVGEIWLRGASVADGYWGRDQESRDVFHAKMKDSPAEYLRTGDLGFLKEGELYVTGRSKDLIVLRGRNHFPQDIEATTRSCVGREGGLTTAFPVAGSRGEVLAIVVEIPRRMNSDDYPSLIRDIRRSVIETHEVDPHHVLLVRQATIPLTSSGKVRRSQCREMFEADSIPTKHRYGRSVGGEQTPIPMPTISDTLSRHEVIELIAQWLSDWIVVRAGVNREEIECDRSFADFGLDSVMGLELGVDIEDWSGVEVSPVDAFHHPTVAELSSFLADRIVQSPGAGPAHQNAASPMKQHSA